MESSYFIPPANAFRYRGPGAYMQATREQQVRNGRIAEWTDGYPKGRGMDALDVCEVLCMHCRRRVPWDQCKASKTCTYCKLALWTEDHWKAASLILRMTGDFEAFNQMLRLGAYAPPTP